MPSSMKIKVYPSKLEGKAFLPSSKSQTLRALFFAAFAKSESTIITPLISDDSLVMMNCLKKLGATFLEQENSVFVKPITRKSVNLNPIHLDVGNSGITFRFLTAISILFDAPFIIDGDESIRKQRPIKPLVEALKKLGADCSFLNENQNTPVCIQGKLKKNTTSIVSADSQPITSLFYLGALSEKPFSMTFKGCLEKPWLELSMSWLKFLKIPAKKGSNYFSTKSHNGFLGFQYKVPKDLSALAFFVGISLIHKTSIYLDEVDLNDLQPDRVILKIFQSIGGTYCYDKNTSHLILTPPKEPPGIIFDLEEGIDLLPILSVTACYLRSKSVLYNGKIARSKESDRLHCMATELKKMNASVIEKEDGLEIYPSVLNGTDLEAHRDHRIAISLAIAASKATTFSTINGMEAIEKTFPTFIEVFESLNGKVEK